MEHGESDDKWCCCCCTSTVHYSICFRVTWRRCQSRSLSFSTSGCSLLQTQVVTVLPNTLGGPLLSFKLNGKSQGTSTSTTLHSNYAVDYARTSDESRHVMSCIMSLTAVKPSSMKQCSHPDPHTCATCHVREDVAASESRESP